MLAIMSTYNAPKNITISSGDFEGPMSLFTNVGGLWILKGTDMTNNTNKTSTKTDVIVVTTELSVMEIVMVSSNSDETAVMTTPRKSDTSGAQETFWSGVLFQIAGVCFLSMAIGSL